MPFCPRCGKRFKHLKRVLQHMNQPHGSCQTFMDELVRLSDCLQPGQQDDALGSNELEPQAEDSASGDSVPLEGSHHCHGDADLNSDILFNPEPLAEGPKVRTFVETFEGASKPYGRGPTFMDLFDADKYANERLQNIYYPFASRNEWELASFLLCSSLSMLAIDKFLSLKLIRDLTLSFRTAKDLRGRAEILPQGPKWSGKPWTTIYPTKSPITIFYRDPIHCLQSLLHNPLMKDHIEFTPLRVFQTAEKLVRKFSQWRTGDAAWEMQSKLPPGATLLGTILSSDKTTISAMTGNRSAHPLLISLANLKMDFRMKSTHRAFLLLVLLPIPKFIEKKSKVRGVLEGRLIHECLDFVLQPLKTAAAIGIMMEDPLGYRRYCFTPLASYIVDTPEAALLAGVGGKTSHITMANYKQFGDSFRHEPRTASTTIAQLQQLESQVDPWDIHEYIKEAKLFRLNGVHRPFWRDWPLAEPSVFLTSELLHHFHKQFWDHDMQWCIWAVGATEIDFRFSILQPRVGFRHFHQGISQLKEVTGRDHRNIQRHIIGVIAGAVPKKFLIAIRALMEFRYLVQAPEIDEDACAEITMALQEFHKHKSAILDVGARVGKKKRPINNWYIPKLEFMQSVASNIRANGAVIQWSADITEHAHCTEIKDPARSGNNQDYEHQICRHLDRSDKCRRFDLATSIREARVDFRDRDTNGDTYDDSDNEYDSDNVEYLTSTSSLMTRIQPASLTGPKRLLNNYFDEAKSLQCGEDPNAPHPFRTFSCMSTAYHLNRDASFKQMSVDEVAEKFRLPDLRPALSDFLHRHSEGTSIHAIIGRRIARAGCVLPFQKLQVWTAAQIQSKAYHEPYKILPPLTLNALPPSDKWPEGRYNSVFVNTNPDMLWPQSGLKGHCVAQVRLIMRVVPLRGSGPIPGMESFLTYVQHFDIVPQLNPAFNNRMKGLYPEPASNLYILKRATRSDGESMGDIVPMAQLRGIAELTPCFGDTADPHLTKETSLVFSSTFYLEKFFDKETFFALNNVL